jgi:phage recombination protein Bet
MNQTVARRTHTRQPQNGLPAGSQTTQQNVETAQRQSDQARRRSALDIMAERLDISPSGLKNTLLNTVFKKATDDEFAALIIVANTYNLNPLLKQIYAFPAKGGGIVPVVSIDGWINIINSHEQHDGIEFTDIADENGKLIAIEAIIYRKDRTRPIRVTEYLDECKQNTEPWKNMPTRMLRHKATIQCARYAYGFAGIYDESDAAVGSVSLGSDSAPVPMRDVTPQHQQITADPSFDPQTGEVAVGEQGEGPADQQRGEQQLDDQGREVDPREAVAQDIIARAGKVEFLADYNKLAEEVQPHIDMMSDEDMAGACNKALRDAKQRLTSRK